MFLHLRQVQISRRLLDSLFNSVNGKKLCMRAEFFCLYTAIVFAWEISTSRIICNFSHLEILMIDTIKNILRDSFPYRRYKEIRATLAGIIHHHPAKKLFIVGITWTDGKTTSCNIVYHFLKSQWIKTVFIGTTGAEIDGNTIEGIEKMTSYDPMDLHNILEMAVKYWCTHAVLEVSSHGLEQYRFKNIPFHVAVLTNITAEHLDYHRNIDQYAASKQKLFRSLQNQGKKGIAILPTDDQYGKRRSQRMHFGTCIAYWFSSSANLQATMIREHETSTSCTITYLGRPYTVESPLVGRFNVQNLLGAIGAGLWCGIAMEDMIGSLSSYVHSPWRQTHIALGEADRYIDFAHTPNGLEVMLNYLTMIKGQWRVICLFWAPWCRDRAKRPEMGRVVDRLADIVIVTDDDASTEDRRQIINDILPGIHRAEGETFAILPERRLAIRYACLIAQPWDKILLAGIGHQQVMYTNAGRVERDEEKVLREERQYIQSQK